MEIVQSLGAAEGGGIRPALGAGVVESLKSHRHIRVSEVGARAGAYDIAEHLSLSRRHFAAEGELIVEIAFLFEQLRPFAQRVVEIEVAHDIVPDHARLSRRGDAGRAVPYRAARHSEQVADRQPVGEQLLEIRGEIYAEVDDIAEGESAFCGHRDLGEHGVGAAVQKTAHRNVRLGHGEGDHLLSSQHDHPLAGVPAHCPAVYLVHGVERGKDRELVHDRIARNAASAVKLRRDTVVARVVTNLLAEGHGDGQFASLTADFPFVSHHLPLCSVIRRLPPRSRRASFSGLRTATRTPARG